MTCVVGLSTEPERLADLRKNRMNSLKETEANNRQAEAQRAERNRRLAETDWMASSDLTMSEDWKTYRQALRDLPTHSNWPNLKAPAMDGSGDNDWPVKPE